MYLNELKLTNAVAASNRIEDACWRRNLNPRIVADELQAALSEPTNSSDENFASLSQTEMYDTIVRGELMKMLTWYLGIKTGFTRNLGKSGKYFEHYLEPTLWAKLEATFAGADYDHTWDAFEAMCELFRTVAVAVADHFDFAYLYADDRRVSAHLRHVRALPKDVSTMY